MRLFAFLKRGPRMEPRADREPDSVEQVRARTRHRLLGSLVLVAAGVLLFPLLFDTAPRPLPSDLPIEIPARDGTQPGAVLVWTETPPSAPSRAPSSAPPSDANAAPVIPAISGGVGPATPPRPASNPGRPTTQRPQTDAVLVETAEEAGLRPSPRPPQPQASAPRPSPAASRPNPKTVPPPPPPTPALRSADGARALALLGGEDPARPPATASRYIVQLGAYADEARARDVRRQAEAAGVSTLLQKLETREGVRWRVRVGPFAAKAQAEAAQAKLRAAGLSAALLTL